MRKVCTFSANVPCVWGPPQGSEVQRNDHSLATQRIIDLLRDDRTKESGRKVVNSREVTERYAGGCEAAVR